MYGLQLIEHRTNNWLLKNLEKGLTFAKFTITESSKPRFIACMARLSYVQGNTRVLSTCMLLASFLQIESQVACECLGYL